MLRVLFSPRMVTLHLLALVATTAAVWLGLWQYDAWQARRDAEASTLAQAAPRPLSEVMSADDPFPGDAVGRPVEFRGTWVSGTTLFIEGRRHHGEAGVWVVSPVAVCDTSCAPDNAAMLVVRGWASAPGVVPEAPTGQVTVTGWLQPPEGSGRTDPDPRDDRLLEVRIPDAIQHVDQDLYGAYVIADTATTGLQPVDPASPPDVGTFTALRNLLYALEWWVFGAFALFVWWRWCSDEVRAAREPTSDVAADRDADDAEVPSSP
ncbi:MAG TPA: SURF1 family protein [Nocardioidaceae bacterium]|nr:SURF1 family protein [Nocardioidaceae bacterium]